MSFYIGVFMTKTTWEGKDLIGLHIQVTQSMGECCLRFALNDLSACFLYHLGPPVQRLCTVVWASAHKLSIHKISYRFAYRPTWWRPLLNWDSLFPDGPSLGQIEQKLTSSWGNYKLRMYDSGETNLKKNLLNTNIHIYIKYTTLVCQSERIHFYKNTNVR